MPFLENNPESIWRNITKPFNRGEFFGVLLALGMALLFSYQQSIGLYAYQFDLGNYLNSAHGDYSHYYYAYWTLPIFWFFEKFPFPLAYFIWNSLNILGVFFASRVFGGNALWCLTSYQMIYTIFQGNIAGIIVGLLALFWLCLIKGWWILGGFALLVACTKYQLGIPFGILLLTQALGHWRKKIRFLILPVTVGIASFLVWGFWPIKVLETIRLFPPNASGNISLWNFIGVFSLLLWLPPLFLKIPVQNRLVMLISTFFLSLPYLQQSDLIALFVFIPAPVAFLGNLGYFLAFIRFDSLKYLFIIPLGLYIWALVIVCLPHITSLRKNKSIERIL